MRKAEKIVLKTDAYEPFIDFLKGVCIVLVILNHCLPSNIEYYSFFSLWGKSAVPLFLLIQVFHAYKKGLLRANFNFHKIYKRIILPFLIVELVLLVFRLITLAAKITSLQSLSDHLIKILKCGGIGSGSYYPWIYVQFAILIPLFVPILKKTGHIGIALFFILLSQAVEFFCSIINMPEWIYRLLCIRYVFIIYLGYLLTTKGFSINKKTMVLTILSLISILFFNYINADLSPLFYMSVYKWRTCHWICYFFYAFLLVVIYKFYNKTSSSGTFNSFMLKIGKYSYEIFLFQMCYFEFHGLFLQGLRVFIEKECIISSMGIIFAIIICTVPVVLYKDWRLSRKL